ncbi:MAG: hypothetical protein Q4D23_11370 [Bacteroidales bacterium]|nr:hypothetical protein [Bacteroidales bacterium]
MANEIVRFDENTLKQLLPICLDFADKYKRNEKIDIHDAVDKVGQAFGVDNVDKEAQKQIKKLMQDGLGEVFGKDEAKDITKLFSKNCKPVMSLVYQCAKGDIDASKLFDGLDALCLSSRDTLQGLLQKALGIPEPVAERVADKLGPYTVTVYAFAGAYKIYAKAAKDAALAKAQRIEVERLTNEAIAQLKVQRLEMETLVNVYMLDRLLPFDEGINAMDQSIVNDDDDGFIKANAELWELFGRDSQFKSAEEFDDLMLSDEAFKL